MLVALYIIIFSANILSHQKKLGNALQSLTKKSMKLA